jgi:hemolysin activation/secretion protein
MGGIARRGASWRLMEGASALAVALFLSAGVASAQVVPGQTREEIDPARQARPVAAPVVDPATLYQPGQCPFTGQGRTTLTRIEAQGASLISDAEIQSAVADLIGKDSDLSVLCVARDRVAALYGAKGEALVRVDLPQQRMTGGVLVITVTEGRVVSASVIDADKLGPAAALAADYLSALKTERATRWREVERAFLLVRDIPGADPSFSIRRAETGEANGLEAVAAFAPRRKLDVTLSGQNFGSEEVGREGASIRLDANSFTAFAERTSLILFSGLEGDQRVVQLLEEFRIGASGLTVLGDVAYSESEPGGALAPLELEGRSTVGRLGVRYPVVLTRPLRMDVGARLEWVDQKNDLGAFRQPNGDATALFEESLRVLSAEVVATWRPRQTPGLQGGFQAELRKGLEAFGASEAGDPLLSRPEGRPDFTSVRGQASIRKDVVLSPGRGLYAAAALLGQWAPDPLPAYEEFQVGSYTVGRGFDPGAASGDRALATQIEAGWEAASAQAVWTVFGFVDAAKLWNQDAFGYDSRPWSVGAGVRARTRRGQVSLVYAAPQNAPFPGAVRPKDRLLLSLSTTFSFR